MRRGLTWLVLMPLVVFGSQVAHFTDYWLADPNEADRTKLLEKTGHDYLAQAPLVAAICAVLLLLAFVGAVRRGARRSAVGRLSILPFAISPLLVFVVQEHLERLIHDGSFPLTAVLEPTFPLGLALELPFGILAFLVARALLSIAGRLGRALRGSQPAPSLAAPPRDVSSPTPTVALSRLAPLAVSLGGRAPPLFA